MATHLAAEKAPVAGVVLYGYPLHPAGKPEKLRVDHLSSVDLPLLFFTGSRDALALPELFDAWLRPLPTATTHIIEEADHSFRIPKRSSFGPRSGSRKGPEPDPGMEASLRWLGIQVYLDLGPKST